MRTAPWVRAVPSVFLQGGAAESLGWKGCSGVCRQDSSVPKVWFELAESRKVGAELSQSSASKGRNILPIFVYTLESTVCSPSTPASTDGTDGEVFRLMTTDAVLQRLLVRDSCSVLLHLQARRPPPKGSVAGGQHPPSPS